MKKKQVYTVKRPMHNPPHPGAILRDAVIDALGITVTDAALRLDVDRITLSRLLNQQASVSVEMALRLAKALGTTPDLWLGLQQSYDVWQAQEDEVVDLSRVIPFISHGQQVSL